MSKPRTRTALAAKDSQNALPAASGAPYVLVPLKKHSSPTKATTQDAKPAAKAKKGGIAELRRQLGEVTARTKTATAPIATGVDLDAPTVPTEKESKAGRGGPAAAPPPKPTAASRKQQLEDEVAAAATTLPRSPRPLPVTKQNLKALEPSPVKQAPSFELPLDPVPPSPSNSDLTYASFDENAIETGNPHPPLLPAPLTSKSPVRQHEQFRPAAQARGDSPWLQARLDRFGADEDLERSEFDEELQDEERHWGEQAEGEYGIEWMEEEDNDDEAFAPPPAQQPRQRPYQPRQPRAASPTPAPSIEYDYELEPQDLLAAFLNVDRAIKPAARPRRKDIDEDEDEPVAPQLSPLKEKDDERAGSDEDDGSDADNDAFPDIDAVLAKPSKNGFAKSRKKATSPPLPLSSASSSSPPEKSTSRARSSANRRSSRATIAADSHDDSSAPKSKKKAVAAKGKGKGKGKESAGTLDTEALLGMLPRRKRRVVVPAAEVELDHLDSEEDAEAELTDYEQNTALGKRKTATSDKNPAAASKGKKSKPSSSQPNKRASRKTKKRSKVSDDEEAPDSETERQKEKRMREYKALANFKLGTETVM